LNDLPKVILLIDTRMEMNAKTAWWLAHKNDPELIISMREARVKYYYKNQEKEQARGREYYYKKKALLALAVVSNTPAE